MSNSYLIDDSIWCMIENKNKKVIIDPASEMFLLGTTIDYIAENYNKGIFTKYIDTDEDIYNLIK